MIGNTGGVRNKIGEPAAMPSKNTVYVDQHHAVELEALLQFADLRGKGLARAEHAGLAG